MATFWWRCPKGQCSSLCGPARGRVEERLRVLGDMATLGQVIDLTRHEHLAEIARQTVPDVRVLPL